MESHETVETWANMKAHVLNEHPEMPDPRAGEKVCIGYPHLDQFGANFVDSVLQVIAYDKDHGNHLMRRDGVSTNSAKVAVWGRSMELAHARNTAVAAFLSTDADWLLWWDTDIGVEQDALEKLLAVADPATAPIVGGLCFIEGDYTHDFRGGLRSSLSPTLYDWAWMEPASGMPGNYRLVVRQDWPTDEVIRVGATGCGFLLTHRSVYEKISDWVRSQSKDAPPHIWFERIPGPDGEKCGEDISFCLRANQVGIPILVHTGVTTTHQKTVWYGVPDYRMKPFTPPAGNLIPLPPEQWPKLMINPNAQREAEQSSPIREKQVPEADEQIAIIVPVAKRDNAKTFLQSLSDSLADGQKERRQVRVYVMADEGDEDTALAWQYEVDRYPNVVFDLHRYLRSMGSFAEKVNRGFEISTEPWLFLVGDDVKFHPGWLDQAMATARSTGKPVIGTNDLGNPAVMAGDHATHMFIRRDYVEMKGASWDGPGVVAHEGYRHWFIDNEILAAAKDRDAWAPCLASHVEHLHPYFRKGQMDDTYRIGQEAAQADAALHQRRREFAEAMKEES